MYRPIRERLLSLAQRELKKQWDIEYEKSVQALDHPFYQKKHTVGVTAQEEAEHRVAKSTLWNSERQRRIDAGLYEEVTPARKLAELIASKADLEQELSRLNVEISQLEAR